MFVLLWATGLAQAVESTPDLDWAGAAAALAGHDVIVRRLLRAGADVDAKSANGDTPLLLAARDGRVALIDQLIAQGADPNLNDGGGRSPLWWAIYRQQRLAIALMLERGAAPGAMSTDIYD